MQECALYRGRASLYDRIYHWKDYASEAARVAALLEAGGLPPGARLLEAACGTGSHLAELADAFDVSGFDLSPDMIALARTKLPELAASKLFVADMCGFRVPRPFPALVCLFSSIGYVYPAERLAMAASAFARALEPGGLLVVEPWITPETCAPGHASLHCYDGDDVKLCRTGVTVVDGRISRFDFDWLVTVPGVGVEHFRERHDLWLYTTEELLSIFEGAGFDVRFEPEGLMRARGLLVGRRRG